MELLGSENGKINFWIGVIVWVGWLVLQLIQYGQIHAINDPSYNPGDDGPLQISLSFETLGYLLFSAPVCLFIFPFGFWSWWKKRRINGLPYALDMIGCILTGGYLIYPCGFIVLGLFMMA